MNLSCLLITVFYFNQVLALKPIVVGLITKCQNDLEKENVVGKILSQHIGNLKYGIIHRRFRYKEIDVCNEEDLVMALIDIFTGEEYASESKTNVKHILTYVSDGMMKLMVSVVSFSDIFIWPLQTIGDLNGFLHLPNLNRLMTSVKKPLDVIEDVARTFKWTNIHIVEIGIYESIRIQELVNRLPNQCLMRMNSYKNHQRSCLH